MNIKTRLGVPPAPEPDFTEPQTWSAAVFRDEQLPGGLTLRALVCPAAAGKWQWTISSLDGDRAELICAGIEQDADEARLMASSEVAKCLDNALALTSG